MALALGLALVAWLVSGDRADEPVAEATSERIVSELELREVAASLPYAVYWAGAVPGTELELTESPGGTLVRYLDDEDGDVEALAVGSYPTADPGAELAEFAARAGSVTLRGASGREVVFSDAQPSSVYFADQAGGVQVEVYDPSPQRALAIARSARVRPLR